MITSYTGSVLTTTTNMTAAWGTAFVFPHPPLTSAHEALLSWLRVFPKGPVRLSSLLQIVRVAPPFLGLTLEDMVALLNDLYRRHRVVFISHATQRPDGKTLLVPGVELYG